MLGGNAQVAGERQFAASAISKAVNRSDQRFRNIQSAHRRSGDAPWTVCRGLDEREPFGHVRAGTKSLAARASQDTDV